MALEKHDPEMYRYVKKAITYNGGTQAIFTTPVKCQIIDVIVHATTAFDGDTAIDIGDAGDNAGLLADANVTKTLNAISGHETRLHGAYLWDAVNSAILRKVYIAATAISAYVTTSTGSVGAADVYIIYIDLT